ncbi:acetyl-CoA carboxylase biotin carboxylase subunit [bacterium]|nr:acetyl-CoA carboxylase biotin carboxylase subunit [bacterium]
MFSKILIANRGEIAVRIIRACRELGIKSVAVYSQVDADSLHVKLADESICIGPAAATESYLNVKAILAAAEVSGAQAIHPGYGFMAENDQFAEMCEEHKIIFIGASPENIRRMGDKNCARETVQTVGVPVVPGSDGVIRSEHELKETADRVGYPLMVKASAGGGGKGMRLVESPDQLVELFKIASSEASSAFGNGDIYIEKFVEDPRHIEIQILSDKHGNAVHLGERDCSIQRRHQKLIEESPSPYIDSTIRDAMGAAAIKAAQAIQYQGAGTIEFLVDKHKQFYFIEMNTRIQVEHPVTEFVTNVDLIKQQIKIAATGVLELNQSDITFSGHAIEFRINAEDHTNNFMPAPGLVDLFLPPGGPGVRNDGFVYPGYKVPANYDSLLGKLIVWGRDREEALSRAVRALDEYIISGIPTTIPFHQLVLENEAFQSGNFTTKFIEEHF